MNLSELAQKPKLVKLTLDDKTITEKYGEALEFYVYDRQPLNTFAQLASANPEENFSNVAELLSDLILDEKGNKVISDDKVLPMDVLTQAIKSISETLGK